PPDTNIVGRPVNPSASPLALFSFVGSEPVSLIARFECSLDSAPFSVCSSPVTYSALADGSHTFRVRAVDNSGNTDPTPASFTWTVDTTPPGITADASLTMLWPPDGKLVPDTISGVIADALSGVNPDTVAFRVVDEYGDVQPTGPIVMGPGGRYSFTLMLE